MQKIVAKAIKHDISIYAMHTNLDNISGGVSFQIAKQISLENTNVIITRAPVHPRSLNQGCPY